MLTFNKVKVYWPFTENYSEISVTGEFLYLTKRQIYIPIIFYTHHHEVKPYPQNPTLCSDHFSIIMAR